MRRALVSVVALLALATLLPAQRRPPVQQRPADDERLAVGTIDKISDSAITVNRLNGGEPLTFTYRKDCAFRLDGVSCERKDIKRGMKVVVEGNSATKALLRVLAYDKDPLPRK
jgi:hypothetical protein